MTLNASLGAPDGPTWQLLGDDDAADLRQATTARLAELLDRPPGIELTSSCTHAMEAAAVVLGVGRGDEVVVPAFTFPSTANAFLLSGATIRFADVNPAPGDVDPHSVERATNAATKVVVCTHYGGVGCDMDQLLAQATDGGWHLVEDAAHGLFGTFRGVPLGRFGTIGALSFHRTKNLSSFEGGAIVVNDPALVEDVRTAIDKGTNRVAFETGRVTSYEWTGPGSSWRMPDPMVVLLAEQLQRHEEIQRVRHHVWARYHHELAAWAERVGAVLPMVPRGCEHPAHIFWLVLPSQVDRVEFVAHCAGFGVQVARHYGSLPDSAYGRRIRNSADDCPNAAVLAERLVRLPLHHQLDDEDVDRVVEAVTSAV